MRAALAERNHAAFVAPLPAQAQAQAQAHFYGGGKVWRQQAPRVGRVAFDKGQPPE